MQGVCHRALWIDLCEPILKFLPAKDELDVKFTGGCKK